MKTENESVVLVTGAAGFIGSNCVKVLNDQGYNNLILVDDLGQGIKWKNLVGKRYRELLLKDQLWSWLETHEMPGIVLHLGACSSTVESDANYLHMNNTCYSRRLAQRAIDAGSRFIYASSAATYGDGSEGFSDSELLRLKPLNMYGYSKHAFDLWLQDMGYLERVVGLKYFNVFGPNEWHKGRMSSHVLKMTSQAQSGEIRLFKSNDESYCDGGQMRDFIYVKDAARMTCSLIDHAEICGIFNVGMGVAHTWNQLAEAVIDAVGREASIEYIDMPKDLHKQYQNYTCAQMDKWKSYSQLYQPGRDLCADVTDYVCHHILTETYL